MSHSIRGHRRFLCSTGALSLALWFTASACILGSFYGSTWAQDPLDNPWASENEMSPSETQPAGVEEPPSVLELSEEETRDASEAALTSAAEVYPFQYLIRFGERERWWLLLMITVFGYLLPLPIYARRIQDPRRHPARVAGNWLLTMSFISVAPTLLLMMRRIPSDTSSPGALTLIPFYAQPESYFYLTATSVPLLLLACLAYQSRR